MKDINKDFTKEELDFTDIEKRKEFVNNTKSSLYGGKLYDGNTVIVTVQQGEEFTVKWENSKGWYEGKTYDKDGECIDDILEKIKK